MPRATSPDSPINQTRRSGFVIAAIGLQLLLCSIASAAGACGDSIDRSARRLPAQVAQALREMADRSTTQPINSEFVDEGPGYRLCECPRQPFKSTTSPAVPSMHSGWARRMLNLPPPAAS